MKSPITGTCPIVLRSCYVMSGTDIVLRTGYAMSGTDVGGTTGRLINVNGPSFMKVMVPSASALRRCYAVLGADLAYDATRSWVIRS